MGKKKLPKIVREIQNYPKNEVDYSYQNNVSYSQYSMFSQCPKRWALQYRDKNKIYIPSIHAIFGSALHETLQLYLETMYAKSGAEADRLNIMEIFESSLRENYNIEYKKNQSQHFSTPVELEEFYDDGVEIIKFFQKKRNRYFSKRGWYLVGCEIPILIPPNINYPNLLFQGYLDVVLYHEPTNTFTIIDLKTSTWGWRDKEKKDENKQFQLILYKNFFAKQFGIPKESIDINFIILKRKIYESTDFPIGRIQEFKPPSGKIKTNRAIKLLNEFIDEAFNKKGYSDKEHLPNPSGWNCRFCPFSTEEKLCGLGKQFI